MLQKTMRTMITTLVISHAMTIMAFYITTMMMMMEMTILVRLLTVKSPEERSFVKTWFSGRFSTILLIPHSKDYSPSLTITWEILACRKTHVRC